MRSLSECFEMEPRSPYQNVDEEGGSPRGRLVKKVVAEEFKLRDLPQGTAISCWWMTLPVLYYLAVIAGGILASISTGDVTAAFDNNCIFYANLTLKGLDELLLKNNSKILTRDMIDINMWGDMDTCLFPEYTSVACVMYASVLLVMVLQFGRGGGKSAFRGRGIAESWRIVPIAFIFNLIFLILSSIIFGNIQNGFSTFCDGMSQVGSSKALGNYSSCADVLQYSFPWDKYNTNLYKEYVLAMVGASLQLAGSLLAFLTIIIRCCLPADFIVYRRRKILMAPGIQASYSEDRIEERSSEYVSSHPQQQQQKRSLEKSGEISTTAEFHPQYQSPQSTTLEEKGKHTFEKGYQASSSSVNNEDAESIKSFHSDTSLVARDSLSKIKVVGKISK